MLNGRSAISLVVEQLTPATVWLPSYLCGAVVQAVRHHDARVRFYPVDYNLRVSAEEWVHQLAAGDLVLFVDYFGFPIPRELVLRTRQRGAWVLEDACQALLSVEVGNCSDFVVFSPRKFVGVPDGGILRINSSPGIRDVRLENAPRKWWLRSLKASELRGEFDRHDGDRRWFDIFQWVERAMPIGRFAMSDLARSLLTQSIEYGQIAECRINNYRLLADLLRGVALLPELADDVVPLGFPIRIRNREQVRQILFCEHIYPAIHWQIDCLVPAEYHDSHRLADDILTLPCDQRYNRADMERMARLVRSAVGL